MPPLGAQECFSALSSFLLHLSVMDLCARVFAFVVYSHMCLCAYAPACSLAIMTQLVRSLAASFLSAFVSNLAHGRQPARICAAPIRLRYHCRLAAWRLCRCPLNCLVAAHFGVLYLGAHAGHFSYPASCLPRAPVVVWWAASAWILRFSVVGHGVCGCMCEPWRVMPCR